MSAEFPSKWALRDAKRRERLAEIDKEDEERHDKENARRSRIRIAASEAATKIYKGSIVQLNEALVDFATEILEIAKEDAE